MSTVINVIIALIVFSAIIFFHELGHFTFAKLNGIYVNEFAIGMGPTLFSFTKKETKYSLKLIPMGGFCMMLGEEEDIADEHSFSAKSVWARLSVVLAGPVFNFILAFILAVILIGFCGYDAPTIKDFTQNSPAKEAGLQKGDLITEFAGHKIYNFREVLIYLQFYQGNDAIDVVVSRDGTKHSYSIVPEKKDGSTLIGVQSNGRIKSGVLNVLKYSALELRYQVKTTFLSLEYLISGKLGLKNLSGPVGIVSMMNDTIDAAKESAEGDTSVAIINVIINMINFCILLSANLGVMNLLPIPALDGGRTVFLLFEAIFRKRISTDKEAFVNMVGFMLLIGLMVVVMFQDVIKLFN